jgi:bacterioferritin
MDNNEHNKGLMVNLPYPEVDPACEPKTVCLLKEDYAGSDGEITAINLYIYQHILLDGELDEIAEALLKISIVEMHHMELLGEAIKKLGGDPIYQSNCRMWTADYVNFVKNPRCILMVDIEAEKTAIRNYRRHINMICNPQVQELLERIIMDEELHLEVFKGLLSRLNDIKYV